MRLIKGKRLLAFLLVVVLSLSSLTVQAEEPTGLPSTSQNISADTNPQTEETAVEEKVEQPAEEKPQEEVPQEQVLEEQMPEVNSTEENTVQTSYGIEALKEMEHVNAILKEVGVGFVEANVEEDRMATLAVPQTRETVYTTSLRDNIGVIDQVLYRGPNDWVFLDTWNEGLLGTSNGTPLYCVDPTIFFQPGNKVSEDAALTYNQKTIQMIAAIQYYIDHLLCSRLTENYRYLLKQVGVWMVLDSVHHWFPQNVVLETGNNVKCPCGEWVATHNGNLRNEGFTWASNHYQEFQDAWGVIYKGQGQPLSKWGGTRLTTGTLELIKHSGNQEITNDNSHYSLDGAVYGVYTKDNRTTPKYRITLKEHVDGWSPSGIPVGVKYGYGRLEKIPTGEYFIREITPPKGFAKDDRWYPGENTPIKVGGAVTVRQEVVDQPQMDVIQLLLEKIDQEMQQNKPQGSATLEGARFLVKYYDYTGNSDVDPAELGKRAKRTWVFQTDANGICKYDNAYFVSGDKLYRNAQGEAAFPLGTVTIQEKKAPEGYHINPKVFVRQIQSNGSSQDVNTYQQPIVPDNILKLDFVKKQEGTDIRIEGAVFEHIKPNGVKETMTTDRNGQFTLKGLQYGKHVIREIKAPDGFQVNPNEIVFFVREDNRIESNFHMDASKGEVQFQVTQEGNIQVSMEDRLAPYALQIVKENNKGMKLKGAEFTLYIDKECRQVKEKSVSDEKGKLQFSKLEVGKKYYLQETKAPKGYRKPVDAFGKPVVYELYTTSIPSKDEFIFYVNGKAYTGSSDEMFTVTGLKADRVVNMKVVNQIQMKLPETGSNRMILLMAVGSGLMILTLKKKQKEGEERYEK